MNFSRRKLTAPGPPAPERMKIFAWSRKCMPAVKRRCEELPPRSGGKHLLSLFGALEFEAEHSRWRLLVAGAAQPQGDDAQRFEAQFLEHSPGRRIVDEVRRLEPRQPK